MWSVWVGEGLHPSIIFQELMLSYEKNLEDKVYIQIVF